MFRNMRQHGWFWGRACVHNGREKWCVVLKILVAFLLIGPGKFFDIIVEFQKCRGPKICVIANVDKLCRHFKWLRREEAGDTCYFTRMRVNGLVELAILGIRAVDGFKRDKFCRIRCEVSGVLFHAPSRVMAMFDIVQN